MSLSSFLAIFPSNNMTRNYTILKRNELMTRKCNTIWGDGFYMLFEDATTDAESGSTRVQLGIERTTKKCSEGRSLDVREVACTEKPRFYPDAYEELDRHLDYMVRVAQQSGRRAHQK